MNRGKKSNIIDWKYDCDFDEFYDTIKQKQQKLKINKAARKEFKNINQNIKESK